MTLPDPTASDKTIIAPLRKPVGTLRTSPPAVSSAPVSPWPIVMFTGLAILLLGATAAFVVIHVLTGGRQTDFSEAVLEQELVPVETAGPEEFEPELIPPEDLPQTGPPKIIDLSGNPMIIERRQTLARQLFKVAAPSPAAAKALKLQGEIYKMTDSLAAQGDDLTGSLPGSQESFAFFQSASEGDDPEAGEPGLEAASGQGGRSSTIVAGGDAADGGFSREPMTAHVDTETPVSKIVMARGFDEISAKEIEAAAAQFLGLTSLAKGDVVALRGNLDPGTGLVPVQLSVYRKGRVLGTVSLTDGDRYALGEDPWFGQNIFQEQTEQAAAKSKYRLLDAIYSSAVRNNLPTSVAGETIQLLSRTHDLEQPASDDDSVIILYGSKPRDRKTGFGRVLYVRVEREDGAIECYAFQPKAGAQFECVSGDGEGTAEGGMIAPVKGVIVRKFGPYKDPASKKTGMNFGVDWAAPAGTPVFAAYAGKVTFAGPTKDWGNTVKISHPDKTVTLYGNLQDFARNLSEGNELKAGQRLGFVGQGPGGGEPRLHFELHRNGQPTDPFGTYQAQIEKGGAIEALVYRITTVESANRCDARNPLSTAVGLGQFLNSTWLRIIHDHRPDLEQGRTRAQILALRLDCDLSRQMTTALTRENSNYIRAAGQTATSGNLYLAHFLGPGGAVKALRSPPDIPVRVSMGDAVVNANPFLKGQTTNWLIQWAARKMNYRGRGKAPLPSDSSRAPPKPVRFAQNAQFAQLKTAVEVMLK